MMKKLVLPVLILLIAASWMACKDTTEDTQEVVAEMTNPVDSVFQAQQTRAVRNLNAYSNGIYEKVVVLEKSLASASASEKAGITAEIERLRAMIDRINETLARTSKARSDDWEAVYADIQSLKYDVKSELTNTKKSKERAGELSN